MFLFLLKSSGVCVREVLIKAEEGMGQLLYPNNLNCFSATVAALLNKQLRCRPDLTQISLFWAKFPNLGGK